MITTVYFTEYIQNGCLYTENLRMFTNKITNPISTAPKPKQHRVIYCKVYF